MDVELMIEEIEFSKEIMALQMNPLWGIPLERLYPILQKYIPEYKKYLENGENTRNNTSVLASTLTAII